MSFPSPQEIKVLAKGLGYVERREEASRTIFLQRNNSNDNYPVLVNIFYTTRGVMTKVSHPKSGYNQLWRSNAYDSLEDLAKLLDNPRIHTGKGYRKADMSLRGCILCGHQKKKDNFSNNQWRKGWGESKCKDCIAAGESNQQRQENKTENESNNSARESQQAVPAVVSRQYITCDADGCERVDPSIRCDNCYLAYYCSQACQKRHWKQEHASDCISIEQMRKNHARYGNGPDKDSMRGWAIATQLSGKRTVDALLAQAEYIHQEDGQWETAIELYKQILMSCPDHTSATPPQFRRVWMGFSRCFYEMGIYDKAIHSGMGAIEMNRHFPQAHKYVALSQKATGDYEAAKATMMRAILYEAPWDEENLELNQALLKQL